MAAQRKAANAMSGMTARACDGCLKKRARWFCAADDAFLCQSCDASVHSANQLASRHERVRLETASSKPSPNSDAPAWHRGFTRKPRTPRHNNKVHPKNHQERLSSINSITMDPLVPELGSSEEGSIEEETEELMLCRVPEFDPFSAMENKDGNDLLLINGFDDIHQDGNCELDGLNEFLPSDMDLAEFVADVESLLVGDEEITCDDIKESSIHAPPNVEVKVKEEGLDSVMNWNLDLPFDSVEEEKVVLSTDVNTSGEISNNIFLRLNYEEVISAWANQGNSPWTTASTPIYFNPNDGWPDYQGMYSKDGHMMGYGHIRGSDGEREARVSRYREKRRTRLFSKKIRYEVRKLNAEKRPRMKGRFVKRTSFMGTSSSSSTTFPYITNNNNGTHQLPIN